MNGRRDSRRWYAIAAGTPNHPKLVALSDAAYRQWSILIDWCFTNQTDGLIPEPIIRTRGPRVFRELTTEQIPGRGPLLEQQPDGQYYLHDYLEHNSSKAEIEQAAAIKRANGAKGGRPKLQRIPAA